MDKVLVVEDDPITRRIIKQAVESVGYPVIEAVNGARAVHVLKAHDDIKLVITDLMLPELNGQDLVRILRGNQLWSSIPVIMVSGVVRLSEIVQVLELGAARFLPKPLDISSLKHYVRCCIASDCASAADPRTTNDLH